MAFGCSWLLGMGLAALACIAGATTSPAWPSKPIRIVVPYPAGGSTDLTGRLIAQQLTLQLCVPVIVENISGVGGVTGSDQVRRSPADGYTMVLGSSSTHSVNMTTLKTTPYDPLTDFAPIMLVSTYANAIYVAAKSPIRTVADLQAEARKNTGMAYATPGPTTSGYLTGELLRRASRLEMQPVHYKGIGPAMQDVMAGHVTVGFGDVVALTPYIASGRLRVVAVGSSKRLATMPDVPTVAETYPGFESLAWQAFYAPKGTPDLVVRRLNAEITKALNVPEVRQKLESSGADLPGGSPEDLMKFTRTDLNRWRDLAHDLKLTFE